VDAQEAELCARNPNATREAASETGLDPADAVLRNGFQIRDAKIEHLGWALKTELDHRFSSGRLYFH
jgi:hypothetical protein